MNRTTICIIQEDDSFPNIYVEGHVLPPEGMTLDAAYAVMETASKQWWEREDDDDFKLSFIEFLCQDHGFRLDDDAGWFINRLPEDSIFE